MQELLFLLSARRLMLIDIYMKLTREIELTRFCVGQSSTRNNSNSIKQQLSFVRSARCLMLIYIHMKFRDDSLNGFQVIERTRV